MQSNRTDAEAALAGSVRGLGVCDALRLELQPVQRARLAAQIEALEAEAVEYELRLVRLMRAGLPAPGHGEPFAFVGPAGMLGDVVRASVRDAVQRLSEVARAPRPPEARARLQDAAADAAAWIRTFLDCQAVEAFNFDGGVDPARPW